MFQHRQFFKHFPRLPGTHQVVRPIQRSRYIYMEPRPSPWERGTDMGLVSGIAVKLSPAFLYKVKKFQAGSGPFIKMRNSRFSDSGHFRHFPQRNHRSWSLQGFGRGELTGLTGSNNGAMPRSTQEQQRLQLGSNEMAREVGSKQCRLFRAPA